MTARLELEVYRRLVAYLGGRESLQAFRRWFDGSTWDEGEWESPLVGQIELALAELSSGHRTEEDFRASLRNTLPTVTLELEPIVRADILPVSTSANNQVKRVAGLVATSTTPGSFVGRPHAAEYA